MTVRVVLDSEGCLSACDSAGHAGIGRAGDDPLCAAVTVLVRTAAETLGSRPGSKLEWDAPVRGAFRFSLLKNGSQMGERDWERGVADYLIAGLTRLRNDYPEHLELNILRK